MLELVMTLALVCLLVGAVLWAGGGKTVLAAQGSGIIETIPDVAETAPPPVDEVVLLSYPMAYALGPAPYAAPHPAPATVYDYLDALIDTIAASDADIVCLQEADFASRRTYDVDQLQYIATALGWGFVARALTWECRYLPQPFWRPWRHVGRVRAGQGVISRYPLVQNTRQRLAQSAAQPLLAPLFAPYHTVQMVDVQCGPHALRLLHTHLEPHEAATRHRQAQEVVTFVRQVATPNTVLLGAWQPTEAGLDPALDLLHAGLRDRFRLATAAGAPDQALVGSGLQALATQVLPTPIPGPGPVLLRLRWALPLTTSHGSRLHEHC